MSTSATMPPMLREDATQGKLTPAKRPARRPRVEELRPEIVTQAALLVSGGYGIRATAQALKVHHKTILSLCTRNDADFGTIKRNMAMQAAQLGSSAWTGIDVRKLTDYQRVVAGAILADKVVNLTQGAGTGITINVLQLKSDMSELEAVRAELRALRQGAATDAKPAIDVTPQVAVRGE